MGDLNERTKEIQASGTQSIVGLGLGEKGTSLMIRPIYRSEGRNKLPSEGAQRDPVDENSGNDETSLHWDYVGSAPVGKCPRNARSSYLSPSKKTRRMFSVLGGAKGTRAVV